MKENKLILLKNLTLLLVEDNEELLKNLTSTLSLFFDNIITARDGASGLDLYKKNSVDLVMTDYIMPIMDGYDLAMEIRKDNKKIPIVIMSSHTDQEKLLNVIPLNITEYMIKPLNYKTLTTALLKVLEKLDDQNIFAQQITPTTIYNSITKELTINDKIVSLSVSEIKTLDIMIKLKNTLVSTELLSTSIDNYNYKSDQAIKNIIHRLRGKIGKDTIANVQGF